MSEKETAEDYKTALAELDSNSRPLITMLTMLAEENMNYASTITQIVVDHIKKTPHKLPAMYLLDSIVKNVRADYKRLFSNAIDSVFAEVFKAVDEKTRKKLWDLRQTWNDVFPKSRLYILDVKIHEMDPAWPITSQPNIPQVSSTIHINPNKFSTQSLKTPPAASFPPPTSTSTQDMVELKKLQNEKRALQETRRNVEKLMKEKSSLSNADNFEKPVSSYSNIHVAPWKAKEILPNMSPTTSVDPPKKTKTVLMTQAKRDPRLASQDSARDAHKSASQHESTRDPRLKEGKSLNLQPISLPKDSSLTNIRDPRLTYKLTGNNYTPSSGLMQDGDWREMKRFNKEKLMQRPQPSKSSAEIITKYKKTKKDKDERRDEKKESKNKSSKERLKKSDKEIKEEKEIKAKAEKELKERENREKEERENKAKLEREIKERENKAKVEREIKERENKAKIEREIKEKENKAKAERELKAREEREKTERILKERIEQEMKEQQEEEEMKKKKEEKAKREMESKEVDKKKKEDAQKSSSNKSKSSINKLKSQREKSKRKDKTGDSKPDNKSDTSGESSSGRENKFKTLTGSPRDHIRPRDQILEVESTQEDPDSSLSLKNKSVRNKLQKENSDSDDSDHYNANKPPPSTYANKKVKDQPQPCDEVSMETTNVDTDLRLLTSQTKLPDNSSEAQANQLGGLFGSIDTDLRQLAPPGVQFVHNQQSPMPQVSTGILPGVVVMNPFGSKPDQDLRTTRIPKISRVVEGQENKDPRLRRLREEEDFVSSHASVLDDDARLKKPSFSSPHAAKWEKFREKNPEFKEYQRQASLTEKLEMEMSENPMFSAEAERTPRRGSERDRRYYKFGGNDRDQYDEQTDDKSKENYHFMINHLNDQYKNKEITSNEYGRLMEDIRFRMEMDKIHEVRERESGGGAPHDGRRNRRGNRSYNEGKWSWNKGRNKGRSQQGSRNDFRMEDEWTSEADLPPISQDILRTVAKASETRSIDIDELPREIRSYGEKAVILLDWNDPRLITFESTPCNIVFDEGKFRLTMNTRDDYRDIQIDGETHRIKLGVPTQELMIDGKGYQCFFGQKPISVYLAGQNRTIQLEGKPPKVDIGPNKNLTYLAGKIELVINAKKIVSLYLDAKPQRFNIDGMPFIIKFIDSFRAVSINGVKFPVTFGGLPISISVRGYRKFLSFSELPAGVTPGSTKVRGMEVDDTTLLPSYISSPPRSGPPAFPPPPLPPQFKPTQPNQISPQNVPPMRKPMPNFPPPGGPPMPPTLFGPGMQSPQMLPPPPRMPSVIPTPGMTGIVPGAYMTSGTPQPPNMPMPPMPNLAGNFPPTQQQQTLQPTPPQIDVHSLLNSLIKTGIIGGGKKKDQDFKDKKIKKDHREPEEEEEEDIDDLKDLPPIDQMFALENLRKRNDKLIKRMYRGMQCSSCGLRYGPELTNQYSHHLDWHFRMNKKQQESMKKVNTRKFYLCIDDWLQYEEIEDVDERVPSMFEMENEDGSKSTMVDDEDGEEEIPSVVASSSNPSLGVCPVCHETFDQFYHQNTEEWHYKYAIQVDEINYHPGCYQDMLKSQKQEDELKTTAEEEEKLKQETTEDSEDPKAKTEEHLDTKEEPMIDTTGEEIIYNSEGTKIEFEPMEVEELATEKPENESSEAIVIEEKVKTAKILDEIDLADVENDEPAKIKKEPEKIDKSRRKEPPLMKNANKIGSKGIPFKIKEEPANNYEECSAFVPYIAPLLADIPIKVEIPDERRDDPLTFDIDDDEPEHQYTNGLEPLPTPTWTTLSVNAETDIASSIDGNTELISGPTETSQSVPSIPRIKISVSKPITTVEDQNTDKNMNNNNNTMYLSFLDEFPDEFVPPPFSVDLNLKPLFEGVELIDQPRELRGVEMSSLCCIM